MLTTAVSIFWDAINNVFGLWRGRGDFRGASSAALVVALATVGLKIALTAFTRRIGQQTNNAAIMALAYDHRNDIVAASAASVGIFLGRLGYPWVDPFAGAFVALVILRTGIQILRESSDDLMDTVPGQELHQQIIRALHDLLDARQVEEIQAHRFGPYFVLNITIGIDGALTVAEGDQIATQVERVLCRAFDFVQRVHVHYHPAQT